MAFIGIHVPHDVARAFCSLDVPGEKCTPDSLHVTLLYLGKDIPLETIGRAVVATAEVAEATRPFRLSVENRTSFPKNEEGIPIICPVLSDELHDLHARLKSSLTAHDVDFSKKFPEYKPHVTLSYSEEPTVDEAIGPLEWSAYEMVMWGGDSGDERMSATFPFAFPKKAATEQKLIRMMASMKG